MQQPIPPTVIQPIPSVRPYKPDGVAPVNGVFSLLGAMVVTGLLLGYAAHHIQQHFWLIILFPLGMGFVLGWVGMWCIGKGKIRNRLAGGCMGFLGGALAMVVMHHFDYDAFREKMHEPETAEVVKSIRAMTPAQRQQLIDDEQDKKTARAFVDAAMIDSFMDYLNWEAAQGISISKAGSSSNGAPITGIGVWIYWSIELLIVGAVAYFMTRARASEPFSRIADAWKVPLLLGSFDRTVLPHASAALATGDLPRVVSLNPTNEPGAVFATAHVVRDSVDADEVDVTLQAYSADGKKTTAVGMYTYPAGSLAALQASFAPAAKPEDVAGTTSPSGTESTQTPS